MYCQMTCHHYYQTLFKRNPHLLYLRKPGSLNSSPSTKDAAVGTPIELDLILKYMPSQKNAFHLKNL